MWTAKLAEERLRALTLPALALLLLGISAGGCSGGTDETDAYPTGADVLDTTGTEPDTTGTEPDLGEDYEPGDLPDLGETSELDLLPEIELMPERVSTSFAVRQSVAQIHVWNAEPETGLEVLGPDGDLVAADATDYQGSLIFRELDPGMNYAVRLANDPDDYTGPLTVVSVEDSYPDEDFYASQTLEIGYGYLETRDGTLLSYFSSLPGPPEDGPYPTLVNYSGYSPSRPGQPVGGAAEAFCFMFPILCNAPNFPSGLIMGMMGYAVVGVNIRGTGCSGGAYDYFEPLQLLDGYDVVEIVARQPWVKHHHVGMVGLSFPAIAQLFVSSTKPPSLAAIAPFSVIANTATTLQPGGIHNIGFAMQWIEHVLNKAKPYAHGWITDLVEEGDTICEEHQLLHSQLEDCIQKAYDNPFYTDEIARPLDPSDFVDQVDVPVFLVGQSQDEQTGPHFPILFGLFDNSPSTHFTMTNGVHKDGFSPQIIAEWANFLSFYVDREIPYISNDLRMLVPMFMEQVFGAVLDIPPPRFESYTDFDKAIADYEAEPTVRVIFESGTHPDAAPGAPQGTFEAHFDVWPIPETEVSRWYLHQDGSLQQAQPGPDDGASSFVLDPAAGDRGTLASGSVDVLQPDWNYKQPEPGLAASFISPPLEQDMVLVGSGSVDLWIQSTADDADLEVGLTEVRPDGMESYVMYGWLRASRRKLRDDSTELRPIPTHYEEDAQPLPPGEWTLVRIEMMPMGHIFRAGSQLRIVIDTPGDSMASWRFMLKEFDEPPTHSIAHHEAHASSIALPLIPTVKVPTPLPPCNALRGQPCREYVPYVNTPAE